MTDWAAYAKAYDLMADNNPAYQDIIRLCGDFLNSLSLPEHSILVELGAGTGNFTIVLAQRFPRCIVHHVDSCPAMIEKAAEKCSRLGLTNVVFRLTELEAVHFIEESVSCVVAVHSLYASRAPVDLVHSAARWLELGGTLFACDIGRVIDVTDWARYLFGCCVSDRGLWRTLGLFWRGRSVSSANRQIRRMQQTGEYWLHDTTDFAQVFRQAGLEVFKTEKVYRGYSDFVIARKSRH